IHIQDMPPKKRRTKKKDVKKGHAKKTLKKLIGIDNETFTELSKEYFLIQVRDLEARLMRYQNKCDELEISNKKYESEREQLHHENSEITAFLRRQLDHKVEEIADLQDRLLGLQQTREAEKETYETQITALRQEIVETKEQLTSENMILSGKLASLEEFKQQKEELLEKFAEMEIKLQQQQVEHKDAIYNLEKKAVVDKDRLKREMVQRVNTVAAEFRKVSNKQMADTTKRTIRENVSINAQLGKMSDKTMELIQENDMLRIKEKKHHQQIELLEGNEKELARKNISNQKVIYIVTLLGISMFSRANIAMDRRIQKF
ncbi:uncharacterized protein TRIADDRAFT_20472, partial [Trichoplax adhaerens]